MLVEMMTANSISAGATKPGVTTLARLISAHAPYDGSFDLRIQNVHAIKVSRPSTKATHAMQNPSVCIVAQGAKSVMIGDDVYSYEAAQVAVYSVDIPVAAQITRATPAEPYLTLKIDLDPQKITEPRKARIPERAAAGTRQSSSLRRRSRPAHDRRGNAAHHADGSSGERGSIGPLVIDEILIHLLVSPMGPRIAQMGLTDSNFHRVAKAVSWLRENFDQPADVEALARLVNMSLSAFHRQFRAVTSMSPIQFQKALRLQEARRLMLTSMLDASAAGRRVGYVSASQFSREYGRFFGSAPTKDIHRLREEGHAATEAPP